MSNSKIYFWSTFHRVGTLGIAFISNILIARILSPDDYGLVAMLAIIMGIAWNFTDSGFSDCLIRKTDADKIDYGTVLTFNLVIGATMYLLIYITAPLVSQYFERTELINISRIIGLTILIKAITVSEFTRIRKELEFKKTSIIEISSNIISLIVAYLMARNGFGYWALVFQTLTIGTVNIIILVFLYNWRPFICFNRQRFKSMSSYSFNLLFSYFSNQIGQNLYSVFIGKFQNATSLGFYRQAQKLKDPTVSGLNSIILSTTYPLLAKETDESKRYDMYEAMFNKFLFLQFVMVIILYGTAYSLIDIILGQKWILIVPYFRLMLIGSLLYPISTLNSNIAKIYGNSKLYRNLAFLRNGLLLFALIITMKSSIQIILIGQIIATYISLTFESILCGRIINFGFTKQILIVFFQIWRPIISMIIAYYAVIQIKTSVLHITLILAVFSIVFILLNEKTKQKQYLEFKQQIKKGFAAIS